MNDHPLTSLEPAERSHSRTPICGPIFEDVTHTDWEDSYHGHIDRPTSVSYDRKDMSRMGKVQELKRTFRPLSTFSFLMISQGTWEVLLVAITQGLGDGGLAGLFWSYIWTFFGVLLVNLSLAEMASMAPTSGGQYHWVSEFSPPRHQKCLSHLTGWMLTLSLQAGSASGPFLIGTMLQSFLTINYPDYTPTLWQATLFVCAITGVIYVLNVWCARAMPIVQNMMLIVHVGGFLAMVIVFWVLSPRNTATVVFTQFVDEGGWSSVPLSLMIGQSTPLFALIGCDMAAHISEEIVDASLTVPRAIVGSYIINSAMGLVFLVSFLFSITNIDAAISDETTYPFLWVLRQTVSPSGTNGLLFIAFILVFVSTVSFNLATSRATWAFARDGGLPFSKYLCHVNPKLHVPDRSVLATSIFIVVVSLINLGSDVAFYAIVSLNLMALMITCAIPIACVLTRRLYNPDLLPRARWTLGRWGVPINAGGLAYAAFAFFWSFWPNRIPVTLASNNWGGAIFIIAIIIGIVDFVFRGRAAFQGPVARTRGWRENC